MTIGIFALSLSKLIHRYFFLHLVWYTSKPVGHNTLADTVKDLCREAVIQGYYTNHSWRATTATCGLEKGIADKFIMERTGHGDVRSLQQHQKPTAQRKVEILKAFDLPLGDKVNSYSGKASVRKEVSKRETAGVEIGGEIEKKVKNCGFKSSEKKVVQFINCTFYVGNDFKAWIYFYVILFCKLLSGFLIV